MRSLLRCGSTLFAAALVAACSAAANPGASSEIDGPIPTDGSDAGSTSLDRDSGSTPPRDSGAPPEAHDASPGTMGDASSPPTPDSGSPGPQPDGSTQPDSAPPSSGDGTPTRQACTGNFGSALTTTHGRMDGYLVSIVNVGGSKTCNGDSSHLHLQVEIHNAIYDVAVNVDTLIAERDIAIPDGSWSEGWHPGDALDYAQLGLHSSDFTQPSSQSALAQQIENELATVNHISVFATGYGPTGGHLIHRNGGGNDGAIITEPLSGTSHVMMFTFTSSTPF